MSYRRAYRPKIDIETQDENVPPSYRPWMRYSKNSPQSTHAKLSPSFSNQSI
jgi:hypothetical protein